MGNHYYFVFKLDELIVFFCSYKFTLDELYTMMAMVKLRAESYKDWVCNVQEILENKGNKKRGQKQILKIIRLLNTNVPSFSALC